MRTGRVRRRALPLEQIWAQIFKEAGGHVDRNVMLKDTTLPSISADDGRQLEILVTGLPLERGVPTGVDVTMTSPLHADGTPWNRADVANGVAIARGEKNKRDTYPELVNSAHCSLLTLACETGGRWSSKCVEIVRKLSAAKAETAPPRLQASARATWSRRWWAMLSVTQQEALAASLVNDKMMANGGSAEDVPDLLDVLEMEDCAPPSRLPAR